MEISDKNFWHRHCHEAGLLQMGVTAHSHQLYRLQGRSSSRVIPSMLLSYELALLYGLARDHYNGSGAIIDLGPLLGASTFCLSRGLEDNPYVTASQKQQAIYSFDLFRLGGYNNFVERFAVHNETGNLLPTFLEVTRDYHDYINIHQGDFLSWTWGGGPIEILFVDLAKTWDLNDHVIKTMFPCLLPDQSVLIQQDYVHFNEYWVHITMEWFRDYFEFCGVLRGATAYYRCIKALPEATCQVDLKALPFEEKWALLEAARKRMPPPVQEVMKTAAAKCAIEHGKFDLAEKMLASVDTSKKNR